MWTLVMKRDGTRMAAGKALESVYRYICGGAVKAVR
jgi:hypothetical protein